MLLLIVAFLGFIVSFISGILGIGGGIIMAPLLLYVPPLLGMGNFDMKTVSGLTITQGVFAGLSGVIPHSKHKAVNKELIIFMGTSILIGSLIGGVASKWISDTVLLLIFAVLAIIAAITILLPLEKKQEEELPDKLNFNKTLAIIIAFIIGLLGGMVGQGGSFILIPLMIYILKIPPRLAMGSNLGIVFLSSISGFIGKVITNQIPWLLALALLLGTIPGAWIGALFSNKIQLPLLRYALAAIIIIASLRITYNLILSFY